MKRRIIIMCMGLALLAGCGGQTSGWQTGNVTLVRAVGIDLTEAGVTLTASGEGEAQAVTLTAEGASVADGFKRLQGTGDSFVHVGHVGQLLMGEDFARHETAQLIDFVARDREIGPGAQVWVLRDEQAERTALGGQSNVAARLERLAGGRQVGLRIGCSVTRLMSAMAARGSVPVPALQWEQDVLQPAGYAILRQGQLVGFLDTEQSLGLELLCKQGLGQTVDVSLSDATQLVLSTKRVELRWEPSFSEGRLTGLDLRCAVRLEVTQAASLTARQREEATRQAEAKLCHRMAAALACAQFWDADFVELERWTRMACSAREWSDVDWEQDFRVLTLRVAVSAQTDWPADMVEDSR